MDKDWISIKETEYAAKAQNCKVGIIAKQKLKNFRLEVYMKKKIIMTTILITALIGLTSCTYKGQKDYETNTGLIAIPDYENLYYDDLTKVVYFVFNEGCGNQGYGYMSAYYAPNGLPYLYDPFKQELVEISYSQGEQTGDFQQVLLQY